MLAFSRQKNILFADLSDLTGLNRKAHSEVPENMQCFFEGKRVAQLSKLHANYNNMDESPIFLSVRAISEILAPPFGSTPFMREEAVREAFRRDHLPEVLREYTMKDALAQRIWQDHKKELNELFDAGCTNQEIYEWLCPGLHEDGLEKQRMWFASAINESLDYLREYRADKSFKRSLGIQSSRHMVYRQYTNDPFFRGKPSGTYHGVPLLLQKLKSPVGRAMELHEYIQCQLYAHMAGTQFCYVIQEYKGNRCIGKVFLDDKFYEVIMFRIKMLADSFEIYHRNGKKASMYDAHAINMISHNLSVIATSMKARNAIAWETL